MTTTQWVVLIVGLCAMAACGVVVGYGIVRSALSWRTYVRKVNESEERS